MQVLIADDSPIVQERLKEMLESVPGVEKIFTAGDTKAALNIIKENHLDAAILDIRMPGGGGIRVLQEMTQESRPRVVIMLTNHPEPQFRQFCFDNGADYFFDKSSEFESVADAVASSADKDELRNAVHKTALKQIVTLSKEKQRHAAALRRKDAILNAVGFAAEQFLEAEYWEEKGSIVLERLGQAAAASRCYIFRNYTGDDGEPWTRQICEWCSSRFVSQLGNPDCISMPWRGGGMERWAELMAAGESVQGLIAQFPESEQDVLAPQDVKSIMAIPVFVGRAWWGFIGLDDCEMEREWIDAEADALQAAARTLATAISKQEKETQLRESEARYSDLVNSIREVVCIFDA
ncbi:MAG: response regulator [Verrucomicrobia bacterium]|nr:response regulator [Verrucomicrobiota bacterium]